MKPHFPFALFLIFTPIAANAATPAATIFINSAPRAQSISIETDLATTSDRPCTNIRTGQCCETLPGPPSAPTPPSPDINAGRLAFDVNGVSLGELNPPPPGKAYSTLFSLAGEGWAGGVQWHAGDVIRIRGSGGRIAAFDGKIIMPPDLSGVRPALILPPTSPLVPPPSPQSAYATQRTRIPLNHPIEIFWSPETRINKDTVRVDMTDFTRGGLAVSCVAQDQAGHLMMHIAGSSPFNAGDKGGLVITRNRYATPTKPSANASIIFNASYQFGGSVLFTKH